MLAGTFCLTEYEEQFLKSFHEILQHGFGEISINVSEVREFRTKIIIKAGRSWVYFVDKKLPNLKGDDIL